MNTVDTKEAEGREEFMKLVHELVHNAATQQSGTSAISCLYDQGAKQVVLLSITAHKLNDDFFKIIESQMMEKQLVPTLKPSNSFQ